VRDRNLVRHNRADRVLRHAHAVHIRLFWQRMEAQQIEASAGYWRLPASIHYEVEHAHPLHADVVVCPYCGSTGEYAMRPGHLVERVHDPLGVELLLRGTIRGEAVLRTPDVGMQGLEESLGLDPGNVFLMFPEREDMNTEVVGAVRIGTGGNAASR
jgi:hypothetical protein